MRVGLVGTESSHVDHMLRYCNTDHRAGPTRIVLAAEATRDAGLPTVDTATDLLGHVDAAIITTRDARHHARQAIPLLQAGLPLLVDKPLAASAEDAVAILAAAQRGSALVTSSSALRWHPVLRDLADRQTSAPRAVVATGPADPASPYAGLAFYGIHPVEMALALAPGPIGDIAVRQVPGGIFADTVVGTTAVTLHLIDPTFDPDAGTTPFHVQVTYPGEVLSAELPLGPDYLHPSLDAFFGMVETGTLPVSHEDMLRSIHLLAGITDAIS